MKWEPFAGSGGKFNACEFLNLIWIESLFTAYVRYLLRLNRKVIANDYFITLVELRNISLKQWVTMYRESKIFRTLYIISGSSVQT